MSQNIFSEPSNPYQASTTPSAATTSAEKPVAKPAIPGWAWLFAAACGILPLLTLGGAIPAAIGFGGAGGCISLARNTEYSIAARVLGCLAITVTCWVAVFLFVAVIVLVRHG